MEKIVELLIAQGVLKTPHIIESFRKIKRRDFLPKENAFDEDFDSPIVIGHGQTNSQPFTVATMFEFLQPQKGQKILDVGSGSGWTTALLADIVGPTGRVYGIELILELKVFGEHNVAKYAFKNVTMICGDGAKGLPEHAPFDRIHVAAAARKIPQALLGQLAVGGIMVIPTKQEDIRVIKKVDEKNFSEEVHEGYLFVPLVTDEV